MPRISKRQSHLQKSVENLTALPVSDAIKKLKSITETLPKAIKKPKFDQTVDLVVRLGVDTKQADQMIRGGIVLPHGIGKKKTVVVFAQGENANIAQQAGADVVGGKDLAERIKGGWLDFDAAIATPDMMGVVGPLGKVLGPRGLMPNPRSGTVTTDVANAVREFKAGRVEFRADEGGNVHCVVGKLSFPEEQLVENIEAMLRHLISIKPASSKGIYIRNISISGTMTPGIQVAA